MAIPQFDEYGLWPAGVHVCSMAEIGERLGWNDHRQSLVGQLDTFLTREIRPVFDEPFDVDGSFVTDKEVPADVDVALDLRTANDRRQLRGLLLMHDRQASFRETCGVDFWINLPGINNFSDFFQYVGVKTSRFKGLSPTHRNGTCQRL